MKRRMTLASQSKDSARTKPEVAAAEVVAWVSDCLEAGLCFMAKGILVFENSQFGELVETPTSQSAQSPTQDLTVRSQLFADAMTWNKDTLGARGSKTYRLLNRQGHTIV